MHLFAGAGGGILADLILGHRPIVAIEWDKYACNVLRARAADGWFDGLDVWEGDVREFAAHDYKGRVDIIHAGFPCQDISVAGNTAGVGEGTRSGLYREVLRIADEVRPKYLFLENVANIVTGDDGRMLRTVVGDLASRGYDAVWTCLSAAEVGANHKRDRWWLLAYPMRIDGRTRQESEQSKRGSSRQSISDVCGDVPNTNSIQQPSSFNGGFAKGSTETSPERSKSSSSGSCKKNVSDTMRLGRSRQGEHEQPISPAQERDWKANYAQSRGWWGIEPDVGRVANGIPSRSHRLRALGNGQVPLQAATAFKLLWELKTQ
jgi:DNA (cytosine-5)-methyltransferase 1